MANYEDGVLAESYAEEKLIELCKALRKDAERYRWLRTAGAWESEVGMGILSEEPEKFDAAVDAAMLAQRDVGAA